MEHECGDDSAHNRGHGRWMSAIPIILLAAGQSSRMGGTDKLVQRIDGVPLLRRSVLAALAAGPVIAALPPRPHPRYAALDGLDITRAEIADATEGMNASLRGAMALVPATAPAVMVLLADLPDLTSSDLRSVLLSRSQYPDNLVWRGATNDGAPGHPVIFDQALFHALKELTGDTGAQEIVKQCKGKVHLHCLPDNHALLDLDTPADWEKWRSNRTLK